MIDDDIRVVVADMPSTIHGYTIFKDGFYTIVINDNISYEMKRIAYQHEMSHIRKNDFQGLSADRIEIYAHEVAI